MVSLIGFNLGVERMQLAVAAIMPSLVLLSRTTAYSLFRLDGGLSLSSPRQDGSPNGCSTFEAWLGRCAQDAPRTATRLFHNCGFLEISKAPVVHFGLRS